MPAVTQSKNFIFSPKFFYSFQCHLGDVEQNTLFNFRDFVRHMREHLKGSFKDFYDLQVKKPQVPASDKKAFIFPFVPGSDTYTPCLCC